MPSDIVGRKMELAVAALASLVREEYPSDLSLAEIARTWGPPGVTTAHIEALESVEPLGGNAQNWRARGRSRFRGVTWAEERRKWRASAQNRWLGDFDDELDAARAAEAARRETMPFALPDPELARLAA